MSKRKLLHAVIWVHVRTGKLRLRLRLDKLKFEIEKDFLFVNVYT